MNEQASLRTFLAGSLAGFLAGHILNFGIVQYVQETMGRPGLAGAALFIAFGTPILLGLHAGAVCDRQPAIRVARGYQIPFMVGAGTLALLSISGLPQPVQIAGVLFAAVMIGIGWSYVSPARLVFLARLVPEKQLRGATILFNVLSTIGFGLAPAVLGILQATGDWVSAFSTALGLFIIAEFLFQRMPDVEDDPPAADPAHWWSSARDGLAYVAKTPILAQLLFTTLVVHLLLGPIQVILPRLASEQLGLGTIGRGAFLSLLAPLLIIGGLVALRLRERADAGRWMLFACLASGTGLLSISAVSSLPLAIAMFVLFGLGGGIAVALLAALLQAYCSAAMRGRVMSLYAISTQFFPALGGLISGLVMIGLPPHQSLLTVAGCVIGILLVAIPFLTALRRNLAPTSQHPATVNPA